MDVKYPHSLNASYLNILNHDIIKTDIPSIIINMLTLKYDDFKTYSKKLFKEDINRVINYRYDREYYVVSALVLAIIYSKDWNLFHYIQLLIDAGIDINYGCTTLIMPNKLLDIPHKLRDMTPLEYALDYQYDDVTDILLKAGAQIYFCDKMSNSKLLLYTHRKIHTQFDNLNNEIKELRKDLTNTNNKIKELETIVNYAPPGMYSETGGTEYKAAESDFDILRKN